MNIAYIIRIGAVLVSFFAIFGSGIQAKESELSLDWLTPLKSDFNINGEVEFTDFVAFINHFGSKADETNFDSRYDLIQNGTVDFADFLSFVSGFGKAQTVLDVELLPILDTPGGLQVKFPNSSTITHSISSTGNETERTITDSIVVDFGGGIQGQDFNIEIIGTDPAGEQITGNRASIKMPIFYANAFLPDTPKNNDDRYVIPINIPVMPDALWVYVETEDRDDMEFNLNDTASLIAGRTFDIQDRYSQRRLYKIDRTSRINSDITDIRFRDRIGTSYRVVVTDFGGFKLKR